MKKTILALLISSVFTLNACDKYYLDKPADTNLKFWITQRVTDDDFKDCTYLPGWFGAAEYLDGRYEPVSISEDGYQRITKPEKYVTYLVTGYPDTLDDHAVTRIEITDPKITVYGLTLNSTTEEIKTRMSELSAEKTEYDREYTIEKAYFSFKTDCIRISVPVTNKQNIIY